MSNKNEHKLLTMKKLRKAFGQLVDYHMDELREFIVDDAIRKDSDVREYVLSQIVTYDVLNYINSHMKIQPAIEFMFLENEDEEYEDIDGEDIDYGRVVEIMHTMLNGELETACYDEPSDNYEWNWEDYSLKGYSKKLFKCPAICVSSQKIKEYHYKYDYHLLNAHDEYHCIVYDYVFLTAKGKWKFVRCNDIYCHNRPDDPNYFSTDYLLKHYIRVNEPGHFRIDYLSRHMPVEYMGILFA